MLAANHPSHASTFFLVSAWGALLIAVSAACGGAVEPSSAPFDAGELESSHGPVPKPDAYAPQHPSPQLDATVPHDASTDVPARDAQAPADSAAPTDALAPVDAPGPLDAPNVPPPWLGPAGFTACAAGPEAIYAMGGPDSDVLNGVASVSGSDEAWNARLTSEVYLDLTVEAPGGQADGDWRLVLESLNGLGPGHYTLGTASSQSIAIEVNDIPCLNPSGSFDIYALQSTGSDEAGVLELQASFDITCSGDAGATPLVGCVNYTAPSFAPPAGTVTADPLVPCQSGPRDVFYFQSPTGTQTFVTNLDSTWAVNFAEPNDLRVDLEVGDGRLDLEVVTLNGAALTTAAYGPGAIPPGAPPLLSVVLDGDVSCNATATSFSLVDSEVDDVGHVTSLLLSYDCETGPSGYRGCVRFRY